MSDTGANVVRFDDCELDLAQRELRRGGDVVALEPRVFALLAYLIEQRHRAVDKDEIQSAVWTGLVVSDTALTRAIMKARRAVGDSAETQALIRTVHGHGYRFVGTLERGAAVPAAAPARRRLRRPALFAAVVAVGGALLVALFWPSPAPDGAVRLAILPVDSRVRDPDLAWTRLGLMGFANDLAARSAALSVLPASDVIRYTELNGLPDEDDAAARLEALRRVYGVSHLLASRLEDNASGLRLSYSLYRPDGKVERGTMVGAEPTRLVRGMIHSVGEALGGGPAREINVISEDPFVNEAYSRGLSLSLEGRCSEALRLFSVVRNSLDGASVADYEWANCARILGRWQEAEAVFRAILDNTPAEPATRLRSLAWHGLGTVLIRTGRGDEARRALEAGLDEAQRAADAELQGMLLNNLAIEARQRREFSLARDLLARAIVAHNDAGSGLLPGQIPAAIANIDMAEGDLDRADEHLRQALAAFRATGDRRNEAMMLNNLGYLRRLQAREDEAEPLHLESLAIRRDIGDRVGQGRILGMLSILYEESGRYAQARDAADEAYAIASEANDRLFMATALAQRAQAEVGAGQRDAARQSFRESAAIFESIGDVSRAAQVAVRQARLEWQAGDVQQARHILAGVLATSAHEALHEPAIEALELDGDIASGSGDAGAAIAAYRQALSAMDESGFVERRADIMLKLGERLLDAGDVAGAETLIGHLLGDGERPDAIRLRARYAFVNGDAARAVQMLEAMQRSSANEWTFKDNNALLRYRAAVERVPDDT